MTDTSASQDDAPSRAELVETVARAYAGTGAYGDTLDAIAEASQLDPDVLRAEFGDRISLLLALLEHYDMRGASGGYSQMTPQLSQFDALTPEELAVALTATARRTTMVPGYLRLVALLKAASAGQRHPARDIVRQRQSILRDVLARAIAAQRERLGGTTDPLTAEARASAVVATWEGLVSYSDLNPGQFDALQVLELTLRSALELDRTTHQAPVPPEDDGTDA